MTKIGLTSSNTNELGVIINSERTGELAPMVKLIDIESDAPLESVTIRLILTGPGGKYSDTCSLFPIDVPSPRLHSYNIISLS